MAFELVNFMDALAKFIATATALNYEDLTTPRAIWRNNAVDQNGAAADPFSVLRSYGGLVPYVPLPTPSIQCETVGSSHDAAAAQAATIAGALCFADGRPLRMKQISSAWRINAVLRLTLPGQLGLDAKDRPKFIFNFDVEVCPLSLPPN